MKLTKKQEKEITKVYDTWLHSYLNGDIETYDSFLDDDYHFIGSTNNEEFLNRKETTKFFIETADQLAGKTEIRNGQKTIEKFGEMVILTHVFDAWFLSEGEWSYYGKFRFTSTLLKKKEGWRFVYQHFSTPDIMANEGETLGIDKVTAENLELRNAIKRRTVELELKNRELEVEAALERVRARAMAMQNSSELSDLVDTVFKELAILDFALQACIINLIDIENLCNTVWMKSPDVGNVPDSYLMKFEDYPFHDAMKEGYLKRDAKFIYTIQGTEKKKYDKYLFKDTEFRKISEEAQDSFTSLEKYVCSFTFSNFGGLQTIGQEPLSDENLDILARFGKVFDLTYTRFNDLKLAEAQARESRIELALERVRARTMAMQQSEELGDVATVLFKELNELVENLWTCGFVLCERDRPEDEWWLSTEEGFIPPLFLPNVGDATHHNIYEAWKNGASYHTEQLEGKVLQEHYDWLMTIPAAKEAFEDMKASGQKRPLWQKLHCAYFSYGYLVMITEVPCPEEEIFKRFAKVFDQTYTRFLDLQKAEAQAREAEIELALERVRARTMAMQKSEELSEVATVLFQQVGLLGIPQWTCGFNIWETGDTHFTFYPGGPDGEILASCKVPLTEHPIFRQFDESKKRGDELLVYEKEGEIQADHYRYMHSLPGIGDMLQGMLDSGLEFPTYQIDHVANFLYGNIIFVTYEPFPEMHDVFKRFAKVFEQTYTRFLDLQKAEAQAREAQIEASLERVRSRSMAMHQSDELKDVIKEIFEQMAQLNINAEHAGIVVDYEPKKDFHFWVADNQDIPAKITVPYLDLVWDKQFTEAKEKGKDFFITHLNFEEKNSFYKQLLPHIDGLTKKARDFYFACPGLAASTAIQKDIGIYIENFSGIPYTDEENSILLRIGKVFQQTYTRFLDLQKAEAQARESQIEAALEKVRSRSLAVHRSEEFNEVVSIVFKKLKELQIPATAVGIGIKIDGSKDLNSFVCGENEAGLVITNYRLPYFNNKISKDICNTLENQLDFYAGHYSKEEKNSFYKYVLDHTAEFSHLPEDIKRMIFESPSYTISMVAAKHSVFNINDFEGKDLSENDIDIIKRFSKVFEQAYTRFLDLQKAEAQAREAKIEAALERVRARTMAMQHSTELSDTSALLFQQIQMLGISPWSCGFNIWEKEDTVFTSYMGSPDGGLLKGYKIPLTEEAAFIRFKESRDRGDKLFIDIIEGDALETHYRYFQTLPGIKEMFEEEDQAGRPLPSFQIHHLANFSHGNLMFITYEHCPEAHDIFIRFAKVFEQTYTRFLDLQKAEEQAKEAQIEAALERVRSRTMGMQKSDELLDAAEILSAELVNLEIPHFMSGFVLINETIEKQVVHMGVPGQGRQSKFYLPLKGDAILKKRYINWKNAEPIFYQRVEGEKLVAHMAYVTQHFESEEMVETGLKIPDPVIFYCGNFKEGYVHIVSEVPLNKEQESILVRFTKIFQQTYTRFLDLQKAEAQAREAQIEAALERTRNQSMQMQHSDEIKDLSKIFHEQLHVLNIPSEFSYVWLPEEDKQEHMFWATWSETTKGSTSTLSKSVVYPLDKSEPYTAACYKAWNSKEPVHESKISAKDTTKFFDTWKELLKGAKKLKVRYFPEGIYYAEAYMKYGCFGINIRRALENDEADILHRFAVEFERAYTRFLDLKRAEEQAREAQIEGALERVRSKTMAMHNSQDVGATIGAMFDELVKLGIEKSVRCGIGILDHTKPMELWTASSNSDGEVLLSIGFLDMSIHPLLKGVKKAWKQKEVNFKYELKGKNVLKYFTALNESPDYVFQTDLDSLPKKIIHNSFPFSEGVLFAFSPDNLTIEEEQILKRFTGVFAQTYTRYLDLQKAEAQTRESQIEAALERVRSKTMAMHSSNDVEDTVVTLFEEVLNLGLDPSIRCGIGILEGFEGMETRSTNRGPDGKIALRVGMLDMSIHPMLVGLKKAWKSGKKGYSYEYSKEDVKIYYKALNDEPDYPFNADLKALPEREFHNSFFFSSGILFAFTEDPLSDESFNILNRFAQVFDQTYTRFLDLQKAEAQAHEAQIEMSLEKVRSRTMAMQSSSELVEAANLLFNQVRDLGINAWSAGYNVLSEDKTKSMCWMSSEDQLQDPFPLFFTEEASFVEMGNFLKSDADFFVQELGGKALKQHYNYMISIPELEDTFKHIQDVGLTLPDYQINHLCKFKQGFLLFITYEKSPKAHDIFKRFTKVFEQTYTRFLDLQKAENQSKEAQIELALERVRASTMAMHQSEQLALTAQVLFEQFNLLGVIPDRISIAIFNENKRIFELWATDQSGSNVNHVHDFSIDEPTCMAKTFKAWKEKKETFIVDLKGKELKDWVRFVKEEAKMELDESKFKGRRLQNCAFFSQGYLLLSSHLPITDEMMQLLLRFAKVFQQTYTRFLDLQKAETQAREAIKRTSVDRVRAEIASMRTGTDLNRITPLVWNELTTLDVPFIRCGVFIMDEEKQEVQTHLSTPDGKAIASFNLPFENTEPLTELLPHWREKEMYKDYWDASAFIASMNILMNRGAISSNESYMTDHQPDNLHLHFLPFLQGMLYVGSEVPLSEDELNLVQNLAEAFSTAYSRYEDFNKLELANKKIEKTLVDLKQTQTQLVQSEKMASLGELTAGIAHEIQNPLNFVNNFSEVSAELVDEMNEEIAEGNLDFAKEIAVDLKQNLEKINHHGKRAGEIVKGMLQHSRTSSGQKELTDINALADEYLRLAYHGLRAKDKSFNAKMESDFDPDLPKMEVIPQDIGRVILNMITNAFYAVNEKNKQGPEGYEPMVKVSTRKKGTEIEIRVEDNGNGMPEKVKEKIFQPFFTTKPTGQGTGLGLSLSYDIVQAHGGELKVETKEEVGTTFIIQLTTI